MAGEYRKFLKDKFPNIRLALTSTSMYGITTREDLTPQILDELETYKNEVAENYIRLLNSNMCIPIEEINQSDKYWSSSELYFTS